MIAKTIKWKVEHLHKCICTTYEIFLLQKMNLNLIKPLDPPTSSQDIGGTEEHVKWCHVDSISQI